MSRQPLVGAKTYNFGFYGKLIGAGDFVRRGFPADLYGHWDAWLQRGLLTIRGQLGETWLDAYLCAPIWRFALAPGVAGERAWVGAMMPSVDRVGRYFPLTAVCEARPDASVFSMARGAEPWLELIEPALRETLEGDGLAADSLFERISAAPQSAITGNLDVVSADEDPHSLSVQTSTSPDTNMVARAMAGVLASRHFGQGVTLWWSSGSEQVAAGARLYRGLPSDSDFRRLFADDNSTRQGSSEPS